MTALTLDAAALLAFLRKEPGGPAVAAEFRTPDRTMQLSTVNLGEVVYRLLQEGYDEATIDQRVEELVAIGLALVPLDRAMAVRAGVLRDRHYHRDRSPISYADCVALATCLRTGSELATSDAHLIAAARAENVPVLALPDSTGRLA